MEGGGWRSKNMSPQKDALGGKRLPFLIGVAGGSASGKSTVCEKIMENLREFDIPTVERKVFHLSQESFYRELAGPEKARADVGLFNFDHPSAFDTELMEKCLQDIAEGRTTRIPVYDFKTNARVPGQYTTINAAQIDVVLFEGILVFYFEKVRDLFDMKLFVETDADSRLAKRVMKDTEELGRELDQVLQHYLTFVKPAYEEFCMPTKKYADVIIPRGADNKIGIELISHHISELLSSPPDLSRRLSIITEPRKRHFSDTSNMYDASRRKDLMDVLTRPH